MAFDHVFLWGAQSPGWVGVGTDGTNAWTIAEDFTLSEDGYLQTLEWYRVNAGTTNRPVALRLWRVSDQASIAQAVQIPDNGAIGWQTYIVGDAISLVAGVHYRCSATFAWNGNNLHAEAVGPGVPPAPTPLSFGDPHCWLGKSYGNNNPVFPNLAQVNTLRYGVGVEVTSFNPVTTPPPIPASPADLAAWFSAVPETNTHQTDLPWLTRAAAVNGETNTTTLLSRISANLETTVNSIWSSVGSGLGAAVSAVDAVVDTIADGTATWPTAVSTALGNLQGWASDQADWLVSVGNWTGLGWVTFYGEFLSFLGSIGGQVPLPGAGWSLIDTTNFDTDLAWDQPADLYVVDFTDLGSNIVHTVVAGVDVSYRLAWWSPLDSSQAQGRRFVDFPTCQLSDGGRRMPGLLLRSGAGGSGTVQAWQYTAP